MGLFQNFPYTNFHELNLDQIIKIMRQMQDEWQQVENDWDSMQDFINNYFNNLDVSEEVLQALQTMAGDGELNTIIDPVIVTETASWLAEHITPTSPAVDNTLSIAGAAADAKATGDAVADLKEDLSSIEDFGWSNGYINVNGVISGTMYSDRKYSSYLLCPPNVDVSYIGETNHSGVLGISFYDESRSFISGVANNGTMGDVQTVTSPSGTRYCIISTKPTILSDSYYHPAIQNLDYVTRKAYNNEKSIKTIQKRMDGGIGSDVSPISLPSSFTGNCPVSIYTDGYHYTTDFEANNHKNAG